MAKCKACGKFLSSTDAAKCERCSYPYHRLCVGLSARAKVACTWLCPTCEKAHTTLDHRETTECSSQEQSTNTNNIGNIAQQLFSTPEQSESSVEFMFNFRRELKLSAEEIMNNMRREFQLLREDMGERISNLEKRVIALEESRQNTSPPSDMKDIIEQLKNDINDREQELLLNDVDITNLPEVHGENPLHTALLVAKNIGLNIDERDIVSAERVGVRRINATESAATPGLLPIRPRSLVVRLTRRGLRDQMLASARSRRGGSSADLNLPGPSVRFYVNERLTKLNRQLFRQAREIGSRLGWKYIWTRRGRILAREKTGDSVFSIRSEEDLRKAFGTSVQ